ncbi:MAG TPA: glycerophosphodiester phosphodiesterase, partial [Candidatus Merdenecus merdavium]|nr:glycerophosphodiester phosphodiesterase [Candidatus Merdenecus merdavium]
LSLFHTEEKIPLLSEVLTLVKGCVPLLIEIKLPIRSTKTCELLNEVLKDYQGHYCIESFNTLAIGWYRKNRPDIVRGQLSSKLTKSISEAGFFLNFIVENLLSNFLGRPDFISYCYTDTAKLSYWLNKHLFSAMTMAWTITSPDIYASTLTKFDSFIFEGFHTRA